MNDKVISTTDLLQHMKDHREAFYESAKEAPRQVVDDFITALSAVTQAHKHEIDSSDDLRAEIQLDLDHARSRIIRLRQELNQINKNLDTERNTLRASIVRLEEALRGVLSHGSLSDKNRIARAALEKEEQEGWRANQNPSNKIILPFPPWRDPITDPPPTEFRWVLIKHSDIDWIDSALYIRPGVWRTVGLGNIPVPAGWMYEPGYEVSSEIELI